MIIIIVIIITITMIKPFIKEEKKPQFLYGQCVQYKIKHIKETQINFLRNFTKLKRNF